MHQLIRRLFRILKNDGAMVIGSIFLNSKRESWKSNRYMEEVQSMIVIQAKTNIKISAILIKVA